MVPAVLDTDIQSVAEALRAAASTWITERDAALRSIRHAAKLAEDAGQSVRAIELAIAAAQLTEALPHRCEVDTLVDARETIVTK